jgi:hypothetical protein
MFRGKRRSLGAILFCASLHAAVARAQTAPPEQDEPTDVIDAWAAAVSQSLSPRWAGPRVPWPLPEPRPTSGGAVDSSLYPLHVHASSEAATHEDMRAVLAALERAHFWLEAHDWPTPASDGGIGGTGGFDLYLVDDLGMPAIAPPIELADPEREPIEEVDEKGRSVFDAPLLFGGLDAGVTHALMEVDVDPARIEACAISTYVEAALQGADPAEARAWRVATGDYVAWLDTGFFGCSDDGIVRDQRESWRAWIDADAQSGHGGALFLAMLSARTDGLEGFFIRDLWNGAPQLTWEGEGLRAAPDLWQVVNAVMGMGPTPLLRLIEEIAVARFFIGDAARDAGAPMQLLREVPERARVPIAGDTAWSDLPRRFEPHGLELETFGSAYLTVDTTDAPAGSVLRIWMRGEFGVAWALDAVRLRADGTEGGRVRAPVRPRNTRSYIPLEITNDETAKVLIVVTNLGGRLPDADGPNDQVRTFRVVLDRLGPSG